MKNHPTFTESQALGLIDFHAYKISKMAHDRRAVVEYVDRHAIQLGRAFETVLTARGVAREKNVEVWRAVAQLKANIGRERGCVERYEQATRLVREITTDRAPAEEAA
ncbi:MAG: hypothetical protein LV480_03930 [Methylacidiphilales bacterium]|nr:hypothetical protein [Candidatus Methylacidiphilales bacterium]